ncbi:MAG: ABC transporter permease [Chloroflexi bacterium]|nr:ABC transporter permease [Chloroflexota bacterium]MCH7654366.1 ABC transporter permease [Chloroflexota bacterium]
MAATVVVRDPWTDLLRRVARALALPAQRIASALRLVLRTPSGRIGLPILLMHLILATVGPWLAPYSATEFQEPLAEYQLQPPSWQFWMGTDQFGRDILSRVMSGATSLIAVSVSGAALGIALGTAIGMSSGYRGGRIDEFVMRVMDGLMSFPSLLLALLVMSMLANRPAPLEILQSNWQNILIVVTIGVVTLPRVARVIRSVTLSLKTLEFVQSARLRGERAPYIIFREILPNTLPVLGVEASVRLSYAILTISSLGFLGLGVQPPSPDWGLMLAQSRQFLGSAPWVALGPAAAIASLVVGVNLVADGVKQASGLPREKAAT